MCIGDKCSASIVACDLLLATVFVQISKCICSNFKCNCSNFQMYLYKLLNVFVKIVSNQICTCSHFQIYLFKFSNLFVKIVKCFPNCKLYLCALVTRALLRLLLLVANEAHYLFPPLTAINTKDTLQQLIFMDRFLIELSHVFV